MTATLSWNRGILKTLFILELSFWLRKSMNHQLRKFVIVVQRNAAQFNFSNCNVMLTFPMNICKFVLYEKLIKMRGDYVLLCKGKSHLSPLHINT